MRWIIRGLPGPSADGLDPRFTPNTSISLNTMLKKPHPGQTATRLQAGQVPQTVGTPPGQRGTGGDPRARSGGSAPETTCCLRYQAGEDGGAPGVEPGQDLPRGVLHGRRKRGPLHGSELDRVRVRHYLDGRLLARQWQSRSSLRVADGAGGMDREKVLPGEQGGFRRGGFRDPPGPQGVRRARTVRKGIHGFFRLSAGHSES